MIRNLRLLITSKEVITKIVYSIMLMMVLPVLSWAAPYSFDHEGFTYYCVTGNDVSIVACSQTGEHIDVPAGIIHDDIVYNVTGISANVFKDKTTLKSISFPDGLSYIGTSAFEGCTNLTTIPLPPTTLVEIGMSAFKGCTKLKSINLPSSLKTIGSGAFEGSGLTSIDIPDNVTSIGSESFKDCASLTSVSIPSGVETISNGLFSGCTGLKNIIIPNGVKRIEAGFCDGCTGLVSLTIPKSVTYIESSAFRGCTGKVTINCNIPNPTFYDHGTFKDSQISEVIMGDSVKSIGRYAFGGCTKLSSVTIGQNVTNISEYAFDGCTGLTSITIPDAVTSIGVWAFHGCAGLVSATLGTGVEAIGPSTFAECTELSTLTISAGTIESSAFKNCNKLENLTLGNGVTSIGDEAFSGCSSLKTVDFPSSVTSIGLAAFYGCTSFQSITIPSSVTTIGQYAFGGGCTGKATINCSIPDNTEAFSYDCRFSEIVIGEGVTRIGSNTFRGNSSLLSLTLQEGLHSIGSNAFYDCKNLASVYIPASVTSIEDGAFQICRKLTLTSGSVLSCEIGNSAFDGCSSLTSVTFGNGVGNIGEYAFRSCTELATVTVPEGVTKMKYIGQYAFSECDKMTYFDFPSSLDSLGYSAFEKCSSLNAIHLKEGVRVLEGSTFFGCSGVTSVSLPSTLQKIGGNDFNGCQGTLRLNGNLPDIPNIFSSPFSTAKFNHVVLGEGITKLDDGTFYGCWTLMNVTVERPEPITIYSNVFPNRNYSTLYCPNGGKYKYMAAEFWKEFQNIVTPQYALIYKVDGEVFKTDSIDFEASLTPLAAPTKEGYTFSGWSEIPATMPAYDVVITGTFSINQYTMTFVLDNGQENVMKKQDYASALTAPADPVKTGFTFKGWSPAVPATVPASDMTFTAQWKRNKYKVTWIVDGQSTENEVEYEATIVKPSDPAKEGHTFTGWDKEIPTSMPDNDLTFTAQFSVNNYTLTYKVDGEVYKSSSVAYGTALTSEAAPTKEGHTFSGWSEIPATTPANDVVITGSFSVNSYTLTYKVDGEVYKTSTVAYGTAITPEAAPMKEGHTFSGWSEIPATMPANDVVITGSFSVNSYTLTYKVDDEVYKTSTVAYGTAITPESAPTKEGHTFSGWSEIPATMPANDVVITGTFTVNKYKVRYYVGQQLWAEDEVEYGAKLTLREYTPENANRYAFAGWDGEMYETMPAKDIEYHAMIITGVGSLNTDASGIKAIYDSTGRKLSKMKRGMNVLIMKDGTIRKIYR